MRTLFIVGIVTALLYTQASAQTCETLDVRDSNGTVISTSQICVDESGAWSKPQSGQHSVTQPSTHIVNTISTGSPTVIQTQVYPLATAPAVVDRAPSVKSSQWQPTSGSAKRQSLYAKLGLVCVARKAMFCGTTPCSGRCEGKQGWCDGKTGETYRSLEAMERAYCKPKRQ
jgi:hypothetical protein